ncbi:AAEL014453-PA [Aedes aegypti]|uniref:AAEL014453-PA n=2 Tax=Aedes aegypti TaxID=7159 RepID=A0A1S4G1T1_AEDAE|nr:uncharacterized protein LOC5564471 [Aedes aegypti]EAT33265.1 AAEL014453-PA [Aedes aegypti]
MEENTFSRIGGKYVFICKVLSIFGAIYYFNQLIERKPICVDVSCTDSTKNVITLTIKMIICILSSLLVGFVKTGLKEMKISYIRTYRVFMLIRNLILLMLWTFEILIRKPTQSNAEEEDEKMAQYMALTLFVSSLVITGVELLILRGVQCLTEEKLAEERSCLGA